MHTHGPPWANPPKPAARAIFNSRNIPERPRSSGGLSRAATMVLGAWEGFGGRMIKLNKGPTSPSLRLAVSPVCFSFFHLVFTFLLDRLSSPLPSGQLASGNPVTHYAASSRQRHLEPPCGLGRGVLDRRMRGPASSALPQPLSGALDDARPFRFVIASSHPATTSNRQTRGLDPTPLGTCSRS